MTAKTIEEFFGTLQQATVAGKNGWPDEMYYTDAKGEEHTIEED